ncbi:MAG: type II secretion system F family protein, partial [Microlunatus sp.]|nr:type II secretion system F family protein [Microlunatus sp.]
MPLLIPALGGALVVAGIIGVILGARRTPVAPPAPRRRNQSRLSSRWAGMERRSKILAVAGLIAGALIYLFTGWLIAVVLVPLAAVGLPTLLSAPPSAARIDRLEALEEWTRALAGVLTVGVGLEEALRSTLRSTPEAIRPEVTTLVARLRARISTEEALRAFADDLNDATGDLVAAYLILGARRRGQGLASVLESLAESVAADVRARRAIEADRAKPRTTARWVTIITISVLGFLTLTGDYISPYGS